MALHPERFFDIRKIREMICIAWLCIRNAFFDIRNIHKTIGIAWLYLYVQNAFLMWVISVPTIPTTSKRQGVSVPQPFFSR